MDRLQTQGFHHVTMVSGNAQRTLDFYGGLLGLPLVKKTVNFDDPGAYHLYFGDSMGTPGTLLTFFEWPRAPQGLWGLGGIHHLALGVASAETQLMWKRRLADAGVVVSGPYDRGYFRSIYFRDPDGQILEIATDGPGYAIDEPADDLGHSLIMPDAARLPNGRDEEAIRTAVHPEPVPTISPSMALTGIHHVTGITDDLRAAGELYEEGLGLRLIKKTLNQDDGETKHYFWATYDGAVVSPRSSMTLFGWPPSTRSTRSGTGQTHHIAFRATSEEEQGTWREHLLERGFQVTPVQDRKYFKSLYFHSPDGLLVEIATDGPGFAVDEPEESLGRELQLPAWLESDRARIVDNLRPLAHPEEEQSQDA